MKEPKIMGTESQRPEPPLEVYDETETESSDPHTEGSIFETDSRFFPHIKIESLIRYAQNPEQFSQSDRVAIEGHLRTCQAWKRQNLDLPRDCNGLISEEKIKLGNLF